MKEKYNISWWILYFALAIFFQDSMVGVDTLLPGFIIALQEGRFGQMACVSVLMILFQEGLGTMAFGSVVLWYFSVAIIYLIAKWLFEVENLSFILLLSVVSALAHYGVIHLMLELQNMYIDHQRLLDACMFQAFFTPVLWYIAYFSRRGIRRGN